MAFMNGWDIGLLIVAGYLAVTVLVRMMRVRRDTLVGQLHQQAEAERQRRKREEAQKAQKAQDAQRRRRRA